MARERSAGQSRTYSMHVAQLPVAGFAPGTRRAGYASDVSNNAPNRVDRGLPLRKAIEFLDRSLPIPNDPRSFLIYCGALLLIVGGMMVNVLLSAQILQAEVQLSVLQQRNEVLERQNGELLWEIARATSLQHLKDRAIALGYRPIEKREYIALPLEGDAGDQPATNPTTRAKVEAQVRSGKPAQMAGMDNDTTMNAPLAQWRSLIVGDEVRHDPPVQSAPVRAPSMESQATPWWISTFERTISRVSTYFDRLRTDAAVNE